MKKKYAIVLLLLIALGLLASVLWLKEQLAIDRCLDAGGRWRADKTVCEYAEAR